MTVLALLIIWRPSLDPLCRNQRRRNQLRGSPREGPLHLQAHAVHFPPPLAVCVPPRGSLGSNARQARSADLNCDELGST
jgi:hypothetical protein